MNDTFRFGNPFSLKFLKVLPMYTAVEWHRLGRLAGSIWYRIK